MQTLGYWEPEEYSKLYQTYTYTEPFATLAYSELQAYLEPCQISIIENFIHMQFYLIQRHIDNTVKHLSWDRALY